MGGAALISCFSWGVMPFLPGSFWAAPVAVFVRCVEWVLLSRRLLFCCGTFTSTFFWVTVRLCFFFFLMWSSVVCVQVSFLFCIFSSFFESFFMLNFFLQKCHFRPLRQVRQMNRSGRPLSPTSSSSFTFSLHPPRPPLMEQHHGKEEETQHGREATHERRKRERITTLKERKAAPHDRRDDTYEIYDSEARVLPHHALQRR